LTAAFPDGVGRPVQYGQGLKANVVYQSMFQLVPYNRIEDYFANEVKVPISQGSIYNFNKEAYEKLERFESFVKQQLVASPVLNGDETGINIKGKGAWLHLCANERFTYFFAHQKRGREAMDAMDVLPNFRGVLCHDHWKPYFIYTCAHALCNAHHLRELTWAHEQAKQLWAGEMKVLLLEMNKATQATGVLTPTDANAYYEKYRAIIASGKIECPRAERATESKSKRGRVKQSKARNLLERLSDFETETLRFANAVDVPFTNNLAENNIRMTKVQQKISGCFRSLDNAQIFCRIRSYISTCRKHGIAVTEALKCLFDGKDPPFMRDWTG
jgi:transposase